MLSVDEGISRFGNKEESPKSREYFAKGTGAPVKYLGIWNSLLRRIRTFVPLNQPTNLEAHAGDR
jgi:hypothetical protein